MGFSMHRFQVLVLLVFAAGIGACSRSDADREAAASPDTKVDTTPTAAAAEPFEIEPGLTARVLKKGYGRAAEAGDSVTVDYTGWFRDPVAPEGKGDKFDSSVDRGERFHFELGQGQVIKGWDRGVQGMLIGEKRELTIAPDLAYGKHGYPGAIPPDSTLIFEVELFGAEGPAESE